MNLKDYGLKILLSTLGIPDFYCPYIQSQDAKLELIAQYLKGDLIEQTSQEPLSPKVNILLNEIETNLKQKLPNNIPYIKKWYWPNWKEYAFTISHDVDKITESRAHIWKIRKRFSKLDVLKAILGISNPYNNFKLYAKLEKQYGVRSSFYFLTDEYDFKKITKEIRVLKENKTDLGLHGGFGTHNDSDKLNYEKKKLENILGASIFGLRQHFLKFDFPTTWEVQNQANFLYDTTVGFNDKIGFKNGITFPFFSHDHNIDLLPLIEIPLIIMDAAVWSGLQLTEETALQMIQQIRDLIKQYNGLLTLLWHQCTLKMRGGRIYQDVLKNIIEESTYVTNGTELAEWWYARAEFQIQTSSKNEKLLIHLSNPRNIQNLGLKIEFKEKIELSSTSSNIQLIQKTEKDFKLTFINGNSGEIEFTSV